MSATTHDYAVKLAHFFHAFAVNDWERIVTGHLDALEDSGLAEEVGTLHLGIVGKPAARNAVLAMCEKRMPVTVVAQANKGWEQITLEALRKSADTFDAVLYAHTKGVSNPEGSNDALEDEWRESMTVGVVDNWRKCATLLASYDAVGCHWICHPEANRFCSEPGTMFFGGTFWWARADMIRRLKPPHTKSRYDAELWFGHNGVDDIFDLAPGWPGAGNFTKRPPRPDMSGRYRGKP